MVGIIFGVTQRSASFLLRLSSFTSASPEAGRR